MGVQLTTKEVAGLCGKNESTIRRWAKSGKIQADMFINEFNSPEYLFSVDCLPLDIQRKYFYQLKASLPVPPAGILPERKASKPLDHYTAEEREEIAWWMRTVEEWQRYRSKYPGRKAEADDTFIALCAKTDPEHKLSVDMLYSRWKAIREHNLDGLGGQAGQKPQG